MPNQNLISATLPAETQNKIIQKIAKIKSDLNFLITLQPKEIKSLFKAGNWFAPFIDKAHLAAADHPEILPQVFNSAEFKQDCQLSKDLTAIVTQINELAESLEKTLIAVNSDALSGALEVYAAVKEHRDKVPGLNVMAAEMAEFFPRATKKAAPAV
jgi:hypothetical protein